MYITNKFAFLHVPKTGGTTIMHFLPRLLDMNIQDPSLRMGVKGEYVKYHLPILFMPHEYRHLPRFGFVRNPWAWYVSYGTWCHKNGGDGPIWGIFSEDLTPGTPEYFSTTVKRLLSVGDGTDASRRYTEKMRKAYKRIGPRGHFMTPYNYADYVNDFGAGYYTWWIKSIFYNVFKPESEDSVEIGQVENLVNDYLRIVGKYVDLTPEYIQQVQKLYPQRVREKKYPYQEHYDLELAMMILNKDRKLINKYGYMFEQEEKSLVNT